MSFAPIGGKDAIYSYYYIFRGIRVLIIARKLIGSGVGKSDFRFAVMNCICVKIESPEDRSLDLNAPGVQPGKQDMINLPLYVW